MCLRDRNCISDVVFYLSFYDNTCTDLYSGAYTDVNYHTCNMPVSYTHLGGAGVALSLLLNDTVHDIVINDYDKAIYSFWRAIKEDGERFIDLINNTSVTIDEWKRQKDIYLNSRIYSLELGFATFFLNRTNRSGILTAGPIGGYEQKGVYKIDARFNKETLTKRIQEIIKKKSNIHIYNKDIRRFITSIIPKCGDNSFVYLDPPYYNKGQQLYKNFLTPEDHAQIANLIFNNIKCCLLYTSNRTEASRKEVIFYEKDYQRNGWKRLYNTQ